MALSKLLLSFLLLGIGLNILFFTILTPYFMLWVGDAPSYSDEHIRNHMISTLGVGIISAIVAAAALYGSYSLFWNKINLWSKISFAVVALSIIGYYGFIGITILLYSRY